MKSHELAKLLLSLPDKEVYFSETAGCSECNMYGMPSLHGVERCDVQHIEKAPYPNKEKDIIVING